MYTTRREEREYGRVAVILEWAGRPMHNDNVIEAVMSRDGCIQIEIRKKFLYGSEAKVFLTAIQEMIALRDQEIRDERAVDRIVMGDLREHDGFAVDLTINETMALLATAKDGVVHYKGHDWCIARTDLKDDVCTTRYSAGVKMMPQCAYGARLKHYTDNGRDERVFAVIDSWSDG